MKQPAASPPLWSTVLGVVFLALVGLFVAHASLRPLAGGDYFWQVRNGLDILERGGLPRVEAWSYTAAGTPWNDHEWLFEVGLGLLQSATGWLGVRVLTLALMGGASALVGGVLWRRSGPGAAVLGVSVFVALGSYKFIPAAQTVALVMTLIGWWLALELPLVGRPRRAVLLFGLVLLWGNITAEVLLFLPFVLVAQVALAGGERRRTALMLAALCVVPLINPPGASILDYALGGTAVNLEVNGEFARLWEPAATMPAVTKWAARALWVTLAVCTAWGLSRARTLAALRAPLLSGLALGAGLMLERGLWMLVLPLGLALGKTGRKGELLRFGAAAALLWAHLGALGWGPGLAVRQLGDSGFWAQDLDRRLPVGCGEALAGLPEGTRVLTDRLWSDYLLWRAPGVKVFADGRNREYPLNVHLAAAEVMAGGPAAGRILDGSGTEVVLADDGWGERAGLGWRVEGEGHGCVLWRRE